jgi:2-C-methyl-D-erythritol 4-phosphate cytidylyltransferase
MGPDVDKLFLEVAGAPVIAHTWRRFDAAGFDEIVLVVRDGMQSAFSALAAGLSLRCRWHLVAGGRERQDSVWNGLSALAPSTNVVAIQDGARPCTPIPLIRRCVEVARVGGASVAAQRAVDTIKESEDGRSITRNLDRAKLWSVQTPQCFRVSVIREALFEVQRQGLNITDDTAACALIGQSVELVESSEPNPKVTSPGDLPLVEMLLRGSTL